MRQYNDTENVTLTIYIDKMRPYTVIAPSMSYVDKLLATLNDECKFVMIGELILPKDRVKSITISQD